MRQIRAERLQQWACRNICKYNAEGGDDTLLMVKHCSSCELHLEAVSARKGMEEVMEGWTDDVETADFMRRVEPGAYASVNRAIDLPSSQATKKSAKRGWIGRALRSIGQEIMYGVGIE